MAEGLRADPDFSVVSLRSCRVCGLTEKLLMCASCKSVYYCGKEHQVADWKLHKAACREMKRTIALLSDQLSDKTVPACLSSRNVVVTEPACDDSRACTFYVDTNPDTDEARSASEFWQYAEPFSTGDLSRSLAACSVDAALVPTTSSGSLSSTHSSSGSLHSLHHTDSQSSASSGSLACSHSSTSSLGSNSNPDMTGHEFLKAKILPKSKRHKHFNQVNSGTRRHSHGDANRPDQANKTLADYVVKCLNDYGICVVDNFLSEEKGNKILNEVLELQQAGIFKEGQVVNRRDVTHKVRGDQITWVEIGDLGRDYIGLLIRKLDSLLMACNGRLSRYDINGRTKVCILCI